MFRGTWPYLPSRMGYSPLSAAGRLSSNNTEDYVLSNTQIL